METQTTLKYSFGETTEEVIRERHREWRGLDQYPGPYLMWLQDIAEDHLLTVLDALLCCDAMEVPGAIQLRIDILAALGIDES